jgi:hypothetical protein
LSLAAAAAGATAVTAPGAEAASPPAPAAAAEAAATAQRPRDGADPAAGRSATRGAAAAKPGRRAGPTGDGRRWWEEATDMSICPRRASSEGGAGGLLAWAGLGGGGHWPVGVLARRAGWLVTWWAWFSRRVYEGPSPLRAK